MSNNIKMHDIVASVIMGYYYDYPARVINIGHDIITGQIKYACELIDKPGTIIYLCSDSCKKLDEETVKLFMEKIERKRKKHGLL